MFHTKHPITNIPGSACATMLKDIYNMYIICNENDKLEPCD